MESQVVILIIVTIFALLVSNRAAKLNRSPFFWGILAWVISPLLVWVVLEICGDKRLKPVAEEVESVEESEAMQVAADNPNN